jgi:hypothetical protein
MNQNLGTSAEPERIKDIGIGFDDLRDGDKWRFVWGFFWRSLCVAVLSMAGGAIAGGVIGFISLIFARVFGKSAADALLFVRIAAGGAGLLIGFASLWLLVRWYFGAKWFGHRLRLVKEGT